MITIVVMIIIMKSSWSSLFSLSLSLTWAPDGSRAPHSTRWENKCMSSLRMTIIDIVIIIIILLNIISHSVHTPYHHPHHHSHILTFSFSSSIAKSLNLNFKVTPTRIFSWKFEQFFVRKDISIILEVARWRYLWNAHKISRWLRYNSSSNQVKNIKPIKFP